MNPAKNKKIIFGFDLFLAAFLFLAALAFLLSVKYRENINAGERLVLMASGANREASSDYKNFFQELNKRPVSDIKNITISFQFKPITVTEVTSIFKIGEGKDAIDFVLLPYSTSLGMIAKNTQVVLAADESGETRFLTLKISKAGKICAHIGSNKKKPAWLVNIKDSFPDIIDYIQRGEIGGMEKISNLSIAVSIFKNRYDLLLRDKVFVPLFLFLMLSAAALLIKNIWEVVIAPSVLSSIDDERQKKIDLIGLVILVGFCLSVGYHYILGTYMQMGYPYNTFLDNPGVKFTDFFNIYDANKDLNPYFNDGFSSGYYPFCNIIFAVFSVFSQWASFIFYVIFLFLTVAYCNALMLKTQDKYKHLKNIFIFTLLTYPLLFLIDRGNIDGLVFVLTFIFFILYGHKKYNLSAVMLGLAIAMKAYPIFYAVIFLSDKRYKELILVFLTAGAVTLFSLFFFDGGILENFLFVRNGFGYSAWAGFADNNMLQRGVSLFFVIKAFIIQSGQIKTVNMDKLFILYGMLAKILSLLAALYALLVEKEFWKKVTVLTIAMLIFPPISADYKLVFLSVPVYFFLNYSTDSRQSIFYSVIFALLFIPKDYFFFKSFISDSGYSDISTEFFLNFFLIILLSLGIFYENMNPRAGSDNLRK